jgi:16S rRNA (cytidine1402-2'-O)-methyltransferase
MFQSFTRLRPDARSAGPVTSMPRPIDNRTRPRPASARSVATFTAFGLAAEAQPLSPGLYVVATPIGNLGDVTLRALGTLAAADAVLAEDTRVTKTLLAHYGITTPLVAYHEHSSASVRERMIHRIRDGQALALVSDAGTPLVSDPGFKLVGAAIADGLAVTPIPGPSAVLTALVASGLPTARFFFEGFLPPRSGARRARLGELAGVPGTLMLFEAPHRLPATLADAAAVLGDRPAVVARELTKLFETVRRGTLPSLAEAFSAEGPPKGEIVVLIGQGDALRGEQADVGLDERLREALRRHSIKDAVALVAAETGAPRRAVYARALLLAREETGT